jgi:hypothetical protein
VFSRTVEALGEIEIPVLINGRPGEHRLWAAARYKPCGNVPGVTVEAVISRPANGPAHQALRAIVAILVTAATRRQQLEEELRVRALDAIVPKIPRVLLPVEK